MKHCRKLLCLMIACLLLTGCGAQTAAFGTVEMTCYDEQYEKQLQLVTLELKNKGDMPVFIRTLYFENCYMRLHPHFSVRLQSEESIVHEFQWQIPYQTASVNTEEKLVLQIQDKNGVRNVALIFHKRPLAFSLRRIWMRMMEIFSPMQSLSQPQQHMLQKQPRVE